MLSFIKCVSFSSVNIIVNTDPNAKQEAINNGNEPISIEISKNKPLSQQLSIPQVQKISDTKNPILDSINLFLGTSVGMVVLFFILIFPSFYQVDPGSKVVYTKNDQLQLFGKNFERTKSLSKFLSFIGDNRLSEKPEDFNFITKLPICGYIFLILLSGFTYSIRCIYAKRKQTVKDYLHILMLYFITSVVLFDTVFPIFGLPKASLNDESFVKKIINESNHSKSIIYIYIVAVFLILIFGESLLESKKLLTLIFIISVVLHLLIFIFGLMKIDLPFYEFKK